MTYCHQWTERKWFSCAVLQFTPQHKRHWKWPSAGSIYYRGNELIFFQHQSEENHPAKGIFLFSSPAVCKSNTKFGSSIVSVLYWLNTGSIFNPAFYHVVLLLMVNPDFKASRHVIPCLSLQIVSLWWRFDLIFAWWLWTHISGDVSVDDSPLTTCQMPVLLPITSSLGPSELSQLLYVFLSMCCSVQNVNIYSLCWWLK